MSQVVNQVDLPWTTLITTSSSGAKHPASIWYKVGNETKGRAWFEVRGIFGTGTSVHVAVETATDPRNPDSGSTALVTAVTSNGVVDPDATLASLSMAGSLYYRIVWVISVTTGTGGCRVAGTAQLIQS